MTKCRLLLLGLALVLAGLACSSGDVLQSFVTPTHTPFPTQNEFVRGGPGGDSLSIKETATANARSTDIAEATATAQTTPPGPVSGSIELAGGLCCTGGQTGTEIEVPVALSASSTAGEVKEMRLDYMYVSSEPDVTNAAWQPYQAETGIPIELVSNWVGFTACVQFRDDAGNLSAVYCDDISVEGMPGSSTVTPQTYTSSVSISNNLEWEASVVQGIFVGDQEYWQYKVEHRSADIEWLLGEGEVNDIPIQGYEYSDTFHWSEDGEYLYFAGKSTGGDGCFVNPYRGLKRVDLATGEVEDILTKGWPTMAISPDDTMLAFIDWSRSGLMLLDLETLETREFEQLVQSEDFDELVLGILRQGNIVWSPDSQHILYTVEIGACDRLFTSIIRVDIADGSQTLLLDQDENFYQTVEWPELDRAIVRNRDYIQKEMDPQTGEILER